MTDSFKKTAVELLDAADVKINGSRPWDIRVFDERFYQSVFNLTDPLSPCSQQTKKKGTKKKEGDGQE